ncbi:MAG: hypothetical protein BWZ09_01381 [Alphaproteobacteria bacterium ADurb.BinA305]|nr:MAG: hypothetical protein BWZ09_01381 [Alphaproteobacteria bacterium ADurb.BinA305]
MFTTMMMPKCTGSMPSLMAIGNRIGARISTIDDGSMKLPAISIRMLAMIRKPIIPTPVPIMKSAISCGMFSCVSRKENKTALVMMYSSIALMLAEFSSTLGTSFMPRSLYTNTATKNAYTALIAAASVGVKMPV